MADKNRIIDAIRELNPTAAAEWLATFTMDELREYHDRLMSLMDATAGARWLRRGDTAAIYVREAA